MLLFAIQKQPMETRLTNALWGCRSGATPNPIHDGIVGNATLRGWVLLFPWALEQGHPHFYPTLD